MNEAKKLLSFVLKDEFFLSEEEVKKRAEVVATEHAHENGWSVAEVKLAGDSYIQNDKFKCYPFDVFGHEGGSENSNSSDSDAESVRSNNNRGIAAQPSI